MVTKSLTAAVDYEVHLSVTAVRSFLHLGLFGSQRLGSTQCRSYGRVRLLESALDPSTVSTRTYTGPLSVAFPTKSSSDRSLPVPERER